jgi:ABC-type thiamine transport system ATPase subunit
MSKGNIFNFDMKEWIQLREDLCDVISKLSTEEGNCSVILTTHSMEDTFSSREVQYCLNYPTRVHFGWNSTNAKRTIIN